ncbi:hypothetical protein [Alcanivorax sp.]|jgi:hypothetical protein|uniref:hypothetical protein n=1 Tax=Alcanivorax sp. TaxID=1872427 RepID=UPI0032D97F3B
MKWTIGIATLLASQFAAADYYSSLDDDTCWDARNSGGGPCMVVHNTKWSQYSKGNFIVTYRNSCNNRIYARFCNERKDGSEDCGASGIGAGKTKSWSTSNANGRYSYRSIGVERGSKDWVCSGKVSDWHD